LATSGVWIRLLLPTKPYISQSRHDRAQDSLAPGGDNGQPGRPRKCWVEQVTTITGSPLLMLGMLRRIGQHEERYDPSTAKRRERETGHNRPNLGWYVCVVLCSGKPSRRRRRRAHNKQVSSCSNVLTAASWRHLANESEQSHA